MIIALAIIFISTTIKDIEGVKQKAKLECPILALCVFDYVEQRMIIRFKKRRLVSWRDKEVSRPWSFSSFEGRNPGWERSKKEGIRSAHTQPNRCAFANESPARPLFYLEYAILKKGDMILFNGLPKNEFSQYYYFEFPIHKKCAYFKKIFIL